MRQPSARRVLRCASVAVAVLVAAALMMPVAGPNVQLGQPPEFGWTAYPMLVVQIPGTEPFATVGATAKARAGQWRLTMIAVLS